MLDYELANKLKEAGFPQGLGLEDVFPYAVAAEYMRKKGADTELVYKYDKALEDVKAIYAADDYVRQPSLVELIQACGSIKLVGPNVWDSNELDTYRWTVKKYAKDGRPIKTFGSTPEDAVARLWLALNKK